jgi:hypothetical protein
MSRNADDRLRKVDGRWRFELRTSRRVEPG